MPGLPDAVSGVLAVLETYDSLLDMTESSRTFGVPPSPLADFVQDFLASAEQAVRPAGT